MRTLRLAVLRAARRSRHPAGVPGTLRRDAQHGRSGGRLAPMTVDVQIARSVPRGADAVGIPVATSGAVPRSLRLSWAALAASGFEGKVGQTVVVPTPDGPALVAVGIGDPGTLSTTTLRTAAGSARAGEREAGRRCHRAGRPAGRRLGARGAGSHRRRTARRLPLCGHQARAQHQLAPPAGAHCDQQQGQRCEQRRRAGEGHGGRNRACSRPRQHTAGIPDGVDDGRQGPRARAGQRPDGRGVRRTSPHRDGLRRHARRQPGQQRATPNGAAHLLTAQPNRPSGARRQGRHVRLGRPQPQAERQHVDDEDGHEWRSRGARGDEFAQGDCVAAPRSPAT